MLLDCGATTIYISKRLVMEHHLRTTKFSDKSIRVKLGDSQIVEAELEVLPLKIHVSGLHEMYPCSAVVYAIPDEFDCILGITFFEDMQPQIDWRGRRIEGTREKTLHWKRTGDTCGLMEEGGPVIASGLRRSVEAKGLLAKRPDSCRGAALETDVKPTDETDRDAVQEGTPNVVSRRRDDAQAGKGSAEEDDIATLGRKSTARYTDERSSTRGMYTVVKKMFTIGVVDESGVQTKFITRKKLRKFLRLKIKSINEPDFMLVSKITWRRCARHWTSYATTSCALSCPSVPSARAKFHASVTSWDVTEFEWTQTRCRPSRTGLCRGRKRSFTASWDAEFAVNSTVNSSTKLAPFEADRGYVPLNPLQLAAEQLEQVPKSRRGTGEALAQAQERMRDIYDRNRVEQVFDVGDRVYLSTQHLDPKHTGLPNSTKFGPKWIGPYTVIRKIHNHAYELNIQTGNKLHPVFNTSSLKPYNEPSRLSRPNDVILADGSVGQLVKRLVGKRTHKRRTHFLVEWVGEPKPTWVNVEDLGQVPDLVTEFENCSGATHSSNLHISATCTNGYIQVGHMQCGHHS
ncbi:unnamed protein product [Phytophthora fragariaefolia]|uniref:Unnamed protein product n=1 Tax=Phytophthora fragariaefolia TaxID=1490495 RepID=A0A9W6XGK9_9STRA|nr:unnamed protein product [Phytophthora fragariaefolia]